MRKPIDICGFLMLDKNVIAHPRYVGRTHEKEKIPFQVIQNLSDLVHKNDNMETYIVERKIRISFKTGKHITFISLKINKKFCCNEKLIHLFQI